MLYSGIDMNSAANICHPAKNSLAGGIDEHRQTDVRAAYLSRESARQRACEPKRASSITWASAAA